MWAVKDLGGVGVGGEGVGWRGGAGGRRPRGGWGWGGGLGGESASGRGARGGERPQRRGVKGAAGAAGSRRLCGSCLDRLGGCSRGGERETGGLWSAQPAARGRRRARDRRVFGARGAARPRASARSRQRARCSRRRGRGGSCDGGARRRERERERERAAGSGERGAGRASAGAGGVRRWALAAGKERTGGVQGWLPSLQGRY
jgi:hypothetical protein